MHSSIKIKRERKKFITILLEKKINVLNNRNVKRMLSDITVNIKLINSTSNHCSLFHLIHIEGKQQFFFLSFRSDSFCLVILLHALHYNIKIHKREREMKCQNFFHVITWGRMTLQPWWAFNMNTTDTRFKMKKKIY